LSIFGIAVADVVPEAAGMDAIFPRWPVRAAVPPHAHGVPADSSQQIQAREFHYASVGQVLLGNPPEGFLQSDRCLASGAGLTMMDAMPDSSRPRDIDSADPGLYRYWSREILRWGDCDSQGHINNVQFARFFEGGRIPYMLKAVAATGTEPGEFLLVRLAIDFRGEMHFPGEARVGSRVVRLGRSSVELGHALYQDDRCTALSQAVVVLVDAASRAPIRLPEDLRHQLLNTTT
jgi:acyl-CoA thioester hydrolase